LQKFDNCFLVIIIMAIPCLLKPIKININEESNEMKFFSDLQKYQIAIKKSFALIQQSFIATLCVFRLVLLKSLKYGNKRL
jgi:Ca2+/Na+ antiporter